MFFRLITASFCFFILSLISLRTLAIWQSPPLHPFAYIINTPTDFSARDVILFDPQTGVALQLMHRPTRFSELAIAPDGNHLAFTEPQLGIYTVDILGGQPASIVRGYVGNPLWSPSGDNLLFIDDMSVSIVSLETLEERVVMPLRVATTWLPDGEGIAYSEFNPETRLYDVLLRHLNDDTVVKLFSSDDLIVHLSFSRDESWLAYSVVTGQIALREIATSREIIIEDDANHYAPQWSANGDYLLFIRTPPRQLTIDIAIANRAGEIVFTLKPKGLTLESSVLWWRN